MKGSGRLIILLLLLALVVHNFISSRILNASLESLTQAQITKLTLLSELITQDLKQKSETAFAGTLESYSKRHNLDAVAILDDHDRIKTRFPVRPAADLIPLIEKPRDFFRDTSVQETENHYVRWSPFHYENKVYGLLIASGADRVYHIQRSTKIVGLLNLVILGFAGLLGFYFVESTIKPFRVLVQTAKSAQPNIPVDGSRNEADFLIATFKGVIAKLKEKEQELARLHQTEKARADDVQQLNQDLLRSISSGLVLIDKSGNIQVFNHAAQFILHISPVIALKKPYAGVFQSISPELVRDIDFCFQDHSTSTRPELEVKITGDGTRFLSMNVMALRDRQQMFAGVLCMFTDITENRRLQQHIAQKEKFASLGEMSAGLAHEFRNSLATITGYMQMLENRIQQDQRGYVEALRKELNSLQKVVNDFLSFARPLSLQVSSVALDELIKDCVEEARISSQERKIEFVLAGQFPPIEADESLLRQVFLNLIRNAVESINGITEQGRVEIHGNVSGNAKSIQIEVRDNGTGIAQEDLPKIFTPFYTTKERGIGLGLAIVQKVILQHNGTIDVESGKSGSIFRAQIPMQQS